MAMTDPQLANNTSCNNNNKNPSTNNNNNNHSNNNNNNNDGEPKYLHKKFKKMATVEVSSPLEIKKESAKTIVHQTESSEVTRRGPSNDVTKNINNNNNSSSNKESSKAKESSESGGEPVETKKTGYVCPYCKLSCSKPSVLQKHIRAHTNERPYPCLLCGFAFKTKSNLYKHRRSRAHSAKAEGTADQAGKVSHHLYIYTYIYNHLFIFVITLYLFKGIRRFGHKFVGQCKQWNGNTTAFAFISGIIFQSTRT